MKYAIIFTIFISSIIIYIFFGHNGILKYMELVSVRKSYEQRNVELEKKIKEMERELDLAQKNKEFLENIIRRELGLQKKGEDVYIIENDNYTLSLDKKTESK